MVPEESVNTSGPSQPHATSVDKIKHHNLMTLQKFQLLRIHKHQSFVRYENFSRIWVISGGSTLGHGGNWPDPKPWLFPLKCESETLLGELRCKRDRSVAFKYAKLRFRLGLCPWPGWGSAGQSHRLPSRLGRGQWDTLSILHPNPTPRRLDWPKCVSGWGSDPAGGAQAP